MGRVRMLTEALTALASTGGTAMVTDGWDGVKARFARLFGRGEGAQAEAAAGRLEQSRAVLPGLPDGGFWVRLWVGGHRAFGGGCTAKGRSRSSPWPTTP